MNEKKKTKFPRHLRTQILAISLIPILAITITGCIVTALNMNSLAEESMEKNLRSLAVSVRDSYNLLGEDTYENKGSDTNPMIYKGDYCINEHTEIVDTLFDESNAVATFFWDNTRIMTSVKSKSGQRATGTTMDDPTVLTKVLENGEGHFVTDYDIQGSSYYAYYLPVYQNGTSGDIVGMVFVGSFADDMHSTINFTLIKFVLIISTYFVAAIVIALIISRRISVALNKGVDALNQISKGDLTVKLDDKLLNRKDEIGKLVYSLARLKEELTTIIRDIKGHNTLLVESSHQLETVARETTTTVEQVEKAVEDIAQGASAQAEETQKASEDVIVMGNLISRTNDEVQELDKNAKVMKSSSDEASQTLQELRLINQKSMDAIDIIYEQTNTTNESALKIQEATQLITSIAEETNLLSLNASIEAARAGEQGRGFAVVATQIQNLAEQSNESAMKIADIIQSLINDSKQAVQTMQEVKQIMDDQNKNMDKTERIFETVKEGIDHSFLRVESINNMTASLDDSRISIVDIVQNLTAAAEENAASTEETSAASAEVSATVNDVSDVATNLKEIASKLAEQSNIFRID